MDNNINNFKDLQSFNIEPSSQVWVDIEKQLPQEKKRRIVAWWWSLPLALLLAWGIWALMSDKNGTTIVNNESFTEPTQKISNSNKTNIPKPNEASQNSLVKSVNNKLLLKGSMNNSVSKSVVSRNIKMNLSVNKNASIKVATKLNQTNDKFISTQKKQNSKSEFLIGSDNKTEEEVVKKGDLKTILDSNESSKQSVKNLSLQNKNDSTSATVASVNKKIKSAKRMDWYFSVGGGTNYLSKNNLFNQQKSDAAITSGLSSFPGTVQSNYLELPKTGFNISVGVSGQYTFSKKSAVQFGVKYSYLQNNISVEPIPQTTLNVYNDVYRNGNSMIYKNNFHFISVPVNYSYCFNPNSNYKLSAIVGAEINYAIAKNWLNIDNEKGYYKKDNSKLNSLLMSLQTGLSVNYKNKFSINVLASKYLTPVQKSSSTYYWQQLKLQIDIPFKF